MRFRETQTRLGKLSTLLVAMRAKVLGWVQLGMFGAYVGGFFFILRGRRDTDSVRRLQRLYRPVYLVGGLVMVLALFVQ